MYLSRDGLLKSLVGLFAVLVVAVAVLYVLYKRAGDRDDFTKIFDEVGREPDIAGTIDQWQVADDTAITFIEIAPNKFKRFVLVFDKNTKYRESATPDVEERTLHDGEFGDLRVSRRIEVYLADPPYREEKRNIVDSVIYW